MLDLFESLLTADTPYGLVREFRMLGGHHLVLKLGSDAESKGVYGTRIKLPDIYTKRFVRNLNGIKGLVLRASEPFCRKRAVTTPVVDAATGEVTKKHTVHVADEPAPSDIRAGDVIFFNSYNVGRIPLCGRAESDALVVVRELDVEFIVPEELVEDVSVSGRALVANYTL